MKHTLLFSLFFVFSLGLSAQTSARSLQAEDLRVFPNPVVAHFEVGHSERIQLVRVMNMVGREVKRFEYVPNQKYQVGDLPRGYYLIQLRDSANRVIKTQRISKR